MTRNLITVIFFFISFLFAGCDHNPACEDTSTCEADDTDDTSVIGEGEIFANGWIDSVATDAPIEARGASADYPGNTREALIVPIGTYDVYAGSDPPTPDGIPTQLINGVPWVTPPQLGVQVTENGKANVDLPFNRFFENPDLICHDGFQDIDENRVYVKNGYVLELPKTLGTGSWLEVEYNHLILKGVQVDLGFYISSSSISENTLTFTIAKGDELWFFICD